MVWTGENRLWVTCSEGSKEAQPANSVLTIPLSNNNEKERLDNNNAFQYDAYRLLVATTRCQY